MTPLSPTNPFVEETTNPFAADMEEEEKQGAAAAEAHKLQSPQEQVRAML